MFDILNIFVFRIFKKKKHFMILAGTLIIRYELRKSIDLTERNFFQKHRSSQNI